MRGAVPTATRGQVRGGSPLHTTLRPKRGGQSREDGDEDVEDFTPSAVVVECSHSVKCFSRLDIKVYYQDPPVWRLPLCHLPCRGGWEGSLFPFAKIRHHFSDLYL